MKKGLLTIVALASLVFASAAFADLSRDQVQEVRRILGAKNYSNRMELLRDWKKVSPRDSSAAAQAARDAVKDVDIGDQDDHNFMEGIYSRDLVLNDGTQVTVYMDASTDGAKQEVLAGVRGPKGEVIGGFDFDPSKGVYQMNIMLGGGPDES